jgi:hypothetical protein
LLPRIELKPVHDEIVWLYLFRDFSGSEEDRAAERVCLRLGFTSYPQHWLIHPETLERLASTGRSIPSFLAAVKRASVKPGRSLSAVDRIRDADERADRLAARGSVAKATKALEDEDPLVRLRAVEVLAAKKPAAVLGRAPELLAFPHDPLRYAVCKVLAKVGDDAQARALDALVRDPKPSLNPNVVRIHAVDALARCGDAASVEVLRAHAASGAYFNGLTGRAIAAVVAIAKRDRKARGPARAVLVEAYPPPAKEERARRACLALAKRIHAALVELTGRRVPFPDRYDEAARARLQRAW